MTRRDTSRLQWRGDKLYGLGGKRALDAAATTVAGPSPLHHPPAAPARGQGSSGGRPDPALRPGEDPERARRHAGAREDLRRIRLAAVAGTERRARVLAGLDEAALERWRALWPAWAHPGQLPPPGDWRTWIILAGRGFGKTRAGAEWVSALARADGALRIALVAGSRDEARAVMVEGEAGLLGVGPAGERPRWEDGRGRLVWPNGARAAVFSGQSPEGLRGPEHHIAWCDELAKWAKGEETWTNLQLGLRLGAAPRALVTTTPRATPLMRALLAGAETGDGGVAVTRGRTGDNPALAEAWTRAVRSRWEGTRLGRQELDGELIEEVAGSLWPRELIERGRSGAVAANAATTDNPLSPLACGESPSPLKGRGLVRVVVGVDPPASATGDACGIVVVGRTADGRGLVLDDASVAGLSPDGWARAVGRAAERWGADRVVAEANQGGAMVEAVLRGAAAHMPIQVVHASQAKGARAEPVAALYERGVMAHAGAFPELEDQMAGMTAAGYEGPGRSPDRADALVWAVWELFLRPQRAEPRVMWL